MDFQLTHKILYEVLDIRDEFVLNVLLQYASIRLIEIEPYVIMLY
jgi:hypothetical protein